MAIMKKYIDIKDKTISEQIASMKYKYPHFKTIFTSFNKMKVTGVLQPTARSESYHFVLRYDLKGIPNVRITSPELKENEKGEVIPHLYSTQNLCLYRPKYLEFQKKHFLCDTVIPWISLWLYYYEVWHLTGEWIGGGEHPD